MRKLASHTCGRTTGPVACDGLKQSQTSTEIPTGTLNLAGAVALKWTPFGLIAPLSSCSCVKLLASHAPEPGLTSVHHDCTSVGLNPPSGGVEVGGDIDCTVGGEVGVAAPALEGVLGPPASPPQAAKSSNDTRNMIARNFW